MKYSGIIAAGVICLLAAYLLVSSFSLTSEAGTALGPGFMPRMLGLILLVLGAIDLAGEIKKKKEQSSRDCAEGNRMPKKEQSLLAFAEQAAEAGWKGAEAALQQKDLGRAAVEGEPGVMASGPGIREWIAGHTDLLSIPLLLAYAYTIKPIGFLLSSMAYMALHMLLLTVNKKRNYLLLILLAVLVPCVIYFGFVKLFYLMLPAGIL